MNGNVITKLGYIQSRARLRKELKLLVFKWNCRQTYKDVDWLNIKEELYQIEEKIKQTILTIEEKIKQTILTIEEINKKLRGFKT